MKSQWNRLLFGLLTTVGMLIPGGSLTAQDLATAATVPVRMTVTASVAGDKRMPDIAQEDVRVKRGKEHLQVTDWAPARGNRAGLELFILIDDSSRTQPGLQLDELRRFIRYQPSTTLVGVGYMRNNIVQIAQDLTTDHTLAANSVRLPFGSGVSYGSPYLSAIDLMNRWPDSQNRHEIVMVTDGIDRPHRHSRWERGLRINPRVESASAVAQRKGVMIHTIYSPGVLHPRSSYWDAANGQMGIAKLSDATGGESFFLGIHTPVSFRPYLAELQQTLDNQYLVSFSIAPGKKARLHYVTVSTPIPGVEFNTHDAVWVPSEKSARKSTDAVLVSATASSTGR